MFPYKRYSCRKNPAAVSLLFNNFQDFHRTCLDANTAGNALGNRQLGLMYHNLHRTYLDALAAADAFFLIDHVNAGFGILGNGLMLTYLGTLAALDTYVGLGTGSLGYDLQTAQILVEFLIKCFGTCPNTFQASHAGDVFFYGKLFHSKDFSFFFVVCLLY